MENKKFLSFTDRRLRVRKNSAKPVQFTNICIISSVDEAIPALGKVVRTSRYVEVNPSENFSKFKVTDFSLENLLAVGYDLKDNSLNNRSAIEVTENILAQSSRIEKSINNIS